MSYFIFFFFKQKTAYEMRISDWSSDVCSSDLLERALHAGILIGRGTLEADSPSLDVRLEGLDGRSPRRFLLTRGVAPEGWTAAASPESVAGVDSLLVEGGAGAAAAFLADRKSTRLNSSH